MKHLAIIPITMLLLVACGKKPAATPESEPIHNPGIARLMTPDSNSTCTVGRIISASDNGVTFAWKGAANADNYDVVTKNLLTGVSKTQNTASLQAEVVLSRNTPYSWYIISKSGKTTATAQSSIWKFYNSGVAVSAHAPFPADLVAPTLQQSVTAVAGKVTLSWAGADVDNDVAGYDVYLGTSATNLSLVKSGNIPAVFDAAVTSGATYYWKIITNDSAGNNSASGIFQFTVN